MQELVDLGISELLDEGAVTLVEWGDAVTPALPADFLEVRLDAPEGLTDDRLVTIRSVGPAWPPRAELLRRALARWTVA
jgi:tRNA A37 threonylcarbamoyladenosine biosynthesis protein TsaE